jgi:hypothetical protein
MGTQATAVKKANCDFTLPSPTGAVPTLGETAVGRKTQHSREETALAGNSLIHTTTRQAADTSWTIDELIGEYGTKAASARASTRAGGAALPR